MPHFFVNPKNIKNNAFIIENEEFHYLANVRRFCAGDEINIFDGLGNSFFARIDAVNRKNINGTILSSKTFRLPKMKVSLYTAVPKGERFEWLIEKSSEIGICKVVPVLYLRSSVSSISENKIERYKKISLSASSQSWRADIMDIEKPQSFFSVAEKLSSKQNALNVLSWECEEKQSISGVLKDKTDIGDINIFIGPEGGFDKKEIEIALKNKFYTVTLSTNILRIETAAVVASSLVMANVDLGIYEAK